MVDPFRFDTSHAFISPDKRPTFGNTSTKAAAAFLLKGDWRLSEEITNTAAEEDPDKPQICHL